MMAIDDKYACSSKMWVYALHLLANAAFFGSISIICSMWQNSVGSGKKTVIFSRPVLIVVNCIYLVLVLLLFGLCFTYDDLHDFFRSPAFIIYSMITALKNLFFFSAIVLSGLRILRPLMEAQRHGSDDEMSSKFRGIMLKLVTLIGACTISALLRFVMLCIKIAILSEDYSSDISFTGPEWWLLADFIPRALPSIGFSVIMFGSILTGRATEESKRMREEKDIGESELGKDGISAMKNVNDEPMG